MQHIHALIVDLTLITIYAGITTLIFKKLKQPIVLGYILAGLLAGPYINLLPTVTDKADLTLWADIGVIFLLFGLGLEFSFNKMINVGKSAMITATANIFFMLFLGYNTGLLLGWSVIDSFFLGSMISMSSTTIIIKAFDDLNVKKQRFTDLVFGVLIVEDIVGILLLVLLPTIALSNTINSQELMISTAKLLFFLVLCFVIGIYFVPTLIKKISDSLNEEMLLLLMISLCFGMVLLATSSGFSAALGAFIMGSILAENEHIEKMEKVFKPLKDFFGAIFFVSVGMMVDPHMLITYAWPIFVITCIVILGKVTFSCFGFLVSGQSLKTSMQGAFSLAQVGEFAFIIASLGMSLKVIDAKIYPIIVAVSVVTTFITPLMIKTSDVVVKKLAKWMPEKWSNLIEKNRATGTETQMEEKRWKLLFKSYFLRLVLFSMIIYTIIALSAYFIRPFVSNIISNAWMAKIVTTIATFILSAPFLKALIGWETIFPLYLKEKIALIFCKIKRDSSHETRQTIVSRLEENIDFCSVAEDGQAHRNHFISNNKIAALYYKLWSAKKINRLPLILLTSFRLLLVMFFMATIIHQFLTENEIVTWGLIIITILVISQSRWLFNQYMSIENQFLKNLNGSRLKELTQIKEELQKEEKPKEEDKKEEGKKEDKKEETKKA